MSHLLKNKWWWISIAAILIILLIGHVVVYQEFRSFQFNQVFDKLRDKVTLAKTFFEHLPDTRVDQNELQEIARRTKQRIGVRVTFIDSTGRVIADSDVKQEDLASLENHLNRPEIQQALKRDTGSSFRYSTTVNQKLFYVAEALKVPGLFNGFIRLSYYSGRIHVWMSEIRTTLIISFISTTLAAIVVLSVIFYFVSTSWATVADVARSVKRNEALSIPSDQYRDERGIVVDALRTSVNRLDEKSQQMEKEEQTWQEIIDKLEDPLVIVNKVHHILIYNQPFKTDFVEEIDHPIGKNIFDILRDPNFVEGLSNIENDSKTIELEYQERDSQKRHYYLCRLYPYEHDDQKRILLLFKEITELKQLRAIRRDFVANISHEMKTPLASLIGYAETILNRPEVPSEQQMKFIQRILAQAKRMEALVRDLLQLSELEQGKELQFSSFSLRQLLHASIESFMNTASSNKQKLHFDPPSEELLVEGDPKWIRTVVNNLLQNAILYTPEEGAINVYTTEIEDNRITVVVEDTGIGIDPKFQERIFQRFYRVDDARNIHASGTGLGLAIAKHIIEAHGERIGVESSPRKGSTFWFSMKKLQDIQKSN